MSFEETPPASLLSLFKVIHHYLHFFFYSSLSPNLFLLQSFRQFESEFGLAEEVADFNFNVLLDFLALEQKPTCLTMALLCIRHY